MAGSSLFGKPTGGVCWKVGAAGSTAQFETTTDARRGAGEGRKLVRKLRTVVRAHRGKKKLKEKKMTVIS